MRNSEKISFWKALDWGVIVLFIVLCILGCLSIYGASYNFEQPGFFDLAQRSGKQFIWFVLAIVIAVSILMTDSNTFYSWSFVLYFGVLGLLAITIFIAPDVKGSHSWLILGPISFQPAEFAKFITALALSRFMSSYNFNLKNTRNVLIIMMLIGMPVLLIFMQNETGSALVFLSLLLMLYREGMPGIILFLVVCLASFFVVGLRFGNTFMLGQTSVGQFSVLLLVLMLMCIILVVYRQDFRNMKIILIGNAVAIIAGVLLNVFNVLNFNICMLQLCMFGATVLFLFFQALSYRNSTYSYIAIFVIASAAFLYSTDYAFDNLLEPHQQIRIQILLGMEDDPNGAGYNVNQSKIAIGSGGFLGKGFLNGTQTKLKYVPEQDTDFIFCTVGEEQGFIGSILVLGLYLTLIIRLIQLAERQRSPFSRIYGYCVVSIFFFHVLINIGMVLGILPVIGIPLPFFSYGGSSLWAFTILLFIFLRLDADRVLYR